MNKKITLLGETDRKRYLLPFILVTSLFFCWGFAHSLLDILNKHFQEILHVTRAESGLVQFSVYGGYFLAALPAGYFMNRFGYKRGIVLGLLLYATGAFLFYPAAYLQTFWAFLTALLIIAFGLAFLETAANPYISMLGPRESAERRLNLSQSFNGLGWIFGPLVGGGDHLRDELIRWKPIHYPHLAIHWGGICGAGGGDIVYPHAAPRDR